MSSRPRSPSSAQASRNRGQRAATAPSASRRASPLDASAASSAALAAGSGGGRTVDGNPWDIITGRSSAMVISLRATVLPPGATPSSESERRGRIRCWPVFVALSFDTVRDVALGVAVAAVVLAVVAAIVIKWIVGKRLALVLLLAVAGIVWWQRDTLQD